MVGSLAGAAGILNKNGFLLKKWYLDCVAESGDGAIVYVATLLWKGVSLHYANLLTFLGGKVSSHFSLKTSSEPEHLEDHIRLTLPSPKAEGTWVARQLPVYRTIFGNKHGLVEWQCLQPMAEVDLVVDDRVRIRGLGYAECLTISLLPWQLPLTCLHWGRFLSAHNAVVWIDWQGPVRKRIVVYNGEDRCADTVDVSRLDLSDPATSLELDRGLVLRHGRLGDTILSKISRLGGLLPQNILAVDECKWLSRGTLHSPLGTASGWAIHEVVKWKG